MRQFPSSPLLAALALLLACLFLFGACNDKRARKSEVKQPTPEPTQGTPKVAKEPSPGEKARKRALALDAEILRIKREGVNVKYRIAKARLNDAEQAIEDAPASGDERQAGQNAAESARQEAIDAWLAERKHINDLVCEGRIINARRDGNDVDVRIAKARLNAAKQNLADYERAQLEKQRNGPLTLLDPTIPPDDPPTPEPEKSVIVFDATPSPTVAETPTSNVAPSRAPTPPSKTFLQNVAYSQQSAVQKYPALAMKDSPLNKKFLARLAEWKANHDPRLSKSDWPEKLADECAR